MPCLHSDKALRKLRHELGEPVSRYGPAQHDALARIDTMQLNHSLRKVNTEPDDLVHGSFAPLKRMFPIVARASATTAWEGPCDSKYQLLPFLVCFISGSRSPSAFLVELGADQRRFASLECELIDRKSWADQDRGAPGVVHLDRGLVQPEASAQRAEPPLTHQPRKAARPSRVLSVEHGLPTVGACVACATLPVDNPATSLANRAAELSPQPSTKGSQLQLRKSLLLHAQVNACAMPVEDLISVALRPSEVSP